MVVSFVLIVLGNLICHKVIFIPNVTDKYKSKFLKKSFIASENDDQDRMTDWHDFSECNETLTFSKRYINAGLSDPHL